MKDWSFRNINTPLKVLFTSYMIVVGIGYMMAFTQILFTHGMADGKVGLSVDDIVYSYYGNRNGSLIENKLNGSMKENASDEDRFKIIKWAREGADESSFNESIKPIIENNCVMCHSADSGLPDFTVFKNLQHASETDSGASFASLTRVSHIHLFGIAFIFMFVGLIFSFTSTVPTWLKASAIAMPYLSQVLDIASWWLTKFDPIFAWLVMFGGTGMAIAFAFMWVVSMYEMWIKKY
ncbi:hypothetical protein MMIC_P0113 [Mariprofundus micogutta]|uniref:Elongation factor-1 alpha n=1 Tax=Mariprofundus micogutta TaxID=1921010 RepID=A0A1L8CJT5_9PROT|nr:elongation factor-1 alpha [Mariprofundus micogutta]GAV19184.1 hypothetical protein MMIC_P0113 [Mariprofundus micogutta]